MADQLRLHAYPQVRETAKALFPAPDDGGRDYAAEIARVEAAVAGGPVSPYRGEAPHFHAAAQFDVDLRPAETGPADGPWGRNGDGRRDHAHQRN